MVRLMRLRSDDDRVGHVVVELSADRQQAGAIIRARNNTVATELAAEYIDLGLDEPDAGVPTCSARFSGEVKSDVEPTQHDMCPSDMNR